MYIYIYVFFFTARDTQESAHALPTYSYRVLGGRGWPGGYLADSSGAGVFCIVPLTRLVPHRGQLY